MKNLKTFIIIGVLVIAGAIASAGQITVKVVSSSGSPKAGARVMLSIDGGGTTAEVRTNSSGLANVSWSSGGTSGKIFVNGTRKHDGSLPSAITITD